MYKTFLKILGIVIVGGMAIFVVRLSNTPTSVAQPRQLDQSPIKYAVDTNATEDVVYLSYHLNTSGDNFNPREVGLDLFVQNAHNGYKQTVDSCKNAGSGALDVKEEYLAASVMCDGKIYVARLEKGKIVLYRYIDGLLKNIVTSIIVSPKARTLVVVDSQKLYSDKKNTLSILGNVD